MDFFASTTYVIEKPGMYDVICNCRSQKSFDYVGNRRFRVIIENHSISYENAKSKLDKGLIITSVFQTIQDAGGYFVRKSRRDSNQWEVLTHSQAKEKIGHALRDAIIAKASGRDICSIIVGNRSKLQMKTIRDRRLSLMSGKVGSSSYSMINDLANTTRSRCGQLRKDPSTTAETVQSLSSLDTIADHSSNSDEGCNSSVKSGSSSSILETKTDSKSSESFDSRLVLQGHCRKEDVTSLLTSWMQQ